MSGKRNGNGSALRCLPGEYIQEEAAHVRKSLSAQDGERDVPGTLYCTNLRVAFLPDPATNAEDGAARPFLHSDYDVALPCIGRLVAVNSLTKAKVLSSASTLKFIPEELLIYCRDFRVFRFRFHESGLEPQAFRVTTAIAQAQDSGNRDGRYESTALRNLENSQWNREEEEEEEEKKEEEEERPTLLFETLSDWEAELRRLGAAGWRVSPVNERFDMATSLPKYLWVPSRILDNELKRAFAHFNESRVPRLSWHHPGGSDLLRAACFHADSDPEKKDLRSVEMLMLAGHSQCVVVEVGGDLPTPAEIQQSYSKLWALSLCLADPSVAPSDEKWLSGLEGTRWLDHMRVCLKKANEVSVLLAERSRSVVLQESDDRDLNCLLASLVQVMCDPHARTLSGFQSLVQKEWVAAGHPFLQRLNLFQKSDRDESPVFLLFLDCVRHLLQQFPASFEFTEAYLLALHDSCYVPFAGTFSFNCQRERGRKSQNRFLNQLYTPVNGWRDNLCLEILQKGGYPVEEESGASLPAVWDWALRYDRRQRARFRNPCYSRGARPALNGNFLLQTHNKPENVPAGNRALYVFAKGALSLQTHLFPWKNGSVAKKSFRWAQLLEGPGDQEGGWRRKSGGGLVRHGGMLLSSHSGPWIQLWKRCYLRGNAEAQVGLFAPSVGGLEEELDLLQERLSYWEARTSRGTALDGTKEGR